MSQLTLMDDILNRNNLKYDKLSPEEKQTLSAMVNAVQVSEISVPKMIEYIRAMKHSVELELTAVGLTEDQDTFLKARLRNYLLFEEVLMGPQRAKENLERAVASMAPPLG